MVLPLLKKWEHRVRSIIDARMRYASKKESERLAGNTMNNDQPTIEPQQPVAYDANGRPLYASPTDQVAPAANSPAGAGAPSQVVHVARATEPVPIEVSDEARARHEDSKRQFPWLNLSEHEYVISAVPRHGIGMMPPLVITTLAVSLVLIGIFMYPDVATIFNLPSDSFKWMVILGVALIVGFVIAGYLAIWVYVSNRFFLTNESVIQEIQMSIFSKREQTVSLMNIEDASFSQRGPLQHLLNYGSIRLSTEGEETTYRFDYVANPRKEIAILNNAVEAFKNGRPVEGPSTTIQDD